MWHASGHHNRVRSSPFNMHPFTWSPCKIEQQHMYPSMLAPDPCNVCTGLKISILLCAGLGPFSFSEPCWFCVGEYCEFNGDYARLRAYGTTSSAATTVGVPGGGPYRLLYGLLNGAGPPNSWQASIASTDGSFPAIVLESLVDSEPFGWTERDLEFSLPDGTAAIILTFQARQVCHRP